MLRRVSICCLAVAVAWITAEAGPPNEEESVDVSQVAAMTAAKAASEKGKEKPPFPKFEDVTKNMESHKGLFTLWYYPSSAKDKDTEKLLCQIPVGFLGEKFMLSTSFSGGGFATGFPLDERVVQWEKLNKQLLLIEPQTQYVVDAKQTVSDVVRRTYPERIRTAVPIVTQSPTGDPLIDLGKMLKSNFAGISLMSFGPMSSGPGGGVNPSLSKWTKKKTFELNIEIGVQLAVRRKWPPGSYDKKMVHFSFWKLPKSDYTPRVADDRVGYFLTTNQDWAKPTDARDIFNRYIDRWHLVKRDPSLSVCEPKQPIVFYVEKTVPVKFRRAVRDGILEWNRAFEKIGFVNAVEVRQQTNDNEWKDLDPEDMRYSFFRWIVTGGGFAMGPHRANPFTGQIYDADIVFDDSMVRYYEKSAGRNLPSTVVAMKMRDPVMREFFEKHPEWKRPVQDWETFTYGDDYDEAALREGMLDRMRRRGYVGCEYNEGMKHQVALGYSVLAGQPKEVIDKFLYDLIKEVVMHEVGHTLGLRHNFKASTIYSLEEIQRRRTTGEPTVGSVMDYNPALFFKDNTLEGHFITPTIGPYDEWAIEYGYRPTDGSYEPKTPSEGKQGAPDKEDKEGKVVSANAGSEPMKGISKELWEKLPPEARKLLEAQAGSAEGEVGGDAKPKKKPSIPAFKGKNAAELKMLNAIASRAAEPELAYATDEDTTGWGPDPRTNRFDMGKDPFEWATERIDLINQRMDNILEWGVKERESWYHIRQAFTSLLFEKVRVLDYVGSYIGGLYTSRSHRGDADAAPPFEIVDSDLQRKALAFIEENLFQDKFFSFSPEVLNHLAAPRWWHAGTRIDFRVDFPIHTYISLFQWWNLVDRLLPNTLRRIHDAELKTTDANKLTAAEYLQRIQKACWTDTLDTDKIRKGKWTDGSPLISSIRRSLHREYLNMVELLVRYKPGTLLSPDLHAMVQYSLRNLNEQIEQAINAKGLDFASASHLTACKSRIDRMLEPKLGEF